MIPPVTSIRQRKTHRLIPAKYSVGAESVLAQIADDDEHLQDLFDLDQATNERLWAENDRLPGIGSHELVFGVPGHHIVNAAFTHAQPQGSRFNGPERGAWYAGFELETSQAEIAFHKTLEYAEINRFEDSVYYDDYLADFGGDFHDIRGAKGFSRCLNPASYVASQELAAQLLAIGSLGIIYPCVRRENGRCLVCFRPAMVGNVRKQYRYRFTWVGGRVPEIKRM